MASLQSVKKQARNHCNPPKLPNYTARLRLDERKQLDRHCVISLTTLNASTNDAVSDEYAVIDEDTSTSAAAVHYVVNTANNSTDDNTPAPDMSRNTLFIRFVLHVVYCAQFLCCFCSKPCCHFNEKSIRPALHT